MSGLYHYAVSYIRRPTDRRVRHVGVIARDADDARLQAQRADPEFTATTKSPRRLRPATKERTRG